MQYNRRAGDNPAVYAQAPLWPPGGEEGLIADESNPYVFNLNRETLLNDIFKHIIWSGESMQIALLSIPPRSGTVPEMHPDMDDFFCFLQGQGILMMGEDQHNPIYSTRVNDNYVAIVPAGIWHTLNNVGFIPLKAYLISASCLSRPYTGI